MSEGTAPSPFEGEKAPLPPRVDLYIAAVLLAFGLGVVGLSLAMPRFSEHSQTGLTAPGIVPGFYGVVLSVLAVVLALRAVRRGGLARPVPRAAGAPSDARALGTAALLGTIYAGFLVGTLPFWLASAVFVTAFTIAFEWADSGGRRMRRVVEAVLLGLGTGIVVALVFERVFLVRLP